MLQLCNRSMKIVQVGCRAGSDFLGTSYPAHIQELIISHGLWLVAKLIMSSVLNDALNK